MKKITRLSERDLTRIVRRVINEQDGENPTEDLNNELLDYFQKQIDTMRGSTKHTPDTIAIVMRDRGNDFLLRNQLEEDFGDTEKWGKPKYK